MHNFLWKSRLEAIDGHQNRPSRPMFQLVEGKFIFIIRIIINTIIIIMIYNYQLLALCECVIASAASLTHCQFQRSESFQLKRIEWQRIASHSSSSHMTGSEPHYSSINCTALPSQPELDGNLYRIPQTPPPIASKGSNLTLPS